MPKCIVFTTHPESHGELRDDWLEKPVLPFKERHRIVKEHNKDFSSKIDVLDGRLIRHEKPFISWMFGFMHKVERIAKRNLCFEVAYYIFSKQGDEDSEYVYKTSTPLWFVTIRDGDKIIHPKWEIAFDAISGDLEVRRIGTPEIPEQRYTFWENSEERILDAIRAYARYNPK